MQNNKTPEIRFKRFTDDWEQRKLGEFGKATGGTSLESEFVEKGNYKVISIGSYSETSKYNDQGLRTNKTPKTESKILNKDDLTMILNDKTAAGNIIGRVLLIDADNSYVYNQRTERIEVYKEDFEPSFLYQLLNAENIRSKIIKASQGNTQIYVNWSSISELEYLIPKVKSEQKKIATILNNLDNLITLHQRKHDKLISFKKAMLEKMFPKENEKVPEIRFQGFTDDWEQRKLSNLVDFSKGAGYSKNDLVESGTPIILYGRLYTRYETRISNVDTFVNALDNSVYSEGGEVIVPASGETAEDISRASVVGEKGIILGGDLNILMPRKEIDSVFLALTLSHGKQQREISKVAQGKTIVHIHNDDLRKVDLSYPANEIEQKKIGQYFLNLDNLITLHQCKLEKLKNIKKSMLEKMFV